MLNRKQRRQLPNRPTAQELRKQTTIKVYNRIQTYNEILSEVREAKTIKQIKKYLENRIESSHKYILELYKEDKD